ncbi:ABC-three component system middle component 6 [Lactococcus lactis]|uniref:ABC-three component system middle component 6 n=1 Tax=Lactococcus lactis TaxID=1358 RepID=UPI003D2C32D5
MLLPNETNPEKSLYYYGYEILKEVHNATGNYDLLDLYAKIKDKLSISLKVFAFSLDWLFLIEAIKVNDQGRIEYCI